MIGCQNWPARTGQPGHDSQDRTGRAGLSEQNNHDRISETGQLGKGTWLGDPTRKPQLDGQKRAARTWQAEQDDKDKKKQHRTGRTEQPWLHRQNQTTRTG
jgi:hypothetical protein